MSTFWTKITSIATEFKQACVEQLWLFALLTPLIVLATLGLLHWNSSSKNKHSEAEVLAQVFTSAEITSAEVAMTVAKPIGELLAMQVYTSIRKGNELVAELTVEDIFRNGASNKMLITQHRYSRSSTVAYLQYFKNKKTQTVAEQS